MNGHRRTDAQAGNDQHANGWGTGRVAQIRNWLAATFSRRNRRLDASGATFGHLIARRAERVSNRKRAVADRYIAIHTTLDRGAGMIIFPWPSRVLSPNGRSHWATKAKAVKAMKTLAFYATKESKVLPLTNFRLVFCPPTNRARDLDNLIASMKPALDGMAQAWGVNDSTFRFTAEIGEIVPGGRVIVEASE